MYGALAAVRVSEESVPQAPAESSVLPVWGTAAVLLFNMTMPLTLWAAARLLPQARGFAFGLLTFGLFLGFLPVAFGAPPLSGKEAAALAAVSAALMLPALRRAVER